MMKGFPDLPPIWWAGSMAIIYATLWAFPQFHFVFSGAEIISQAVFFAALLIVAWSAIWFWRKKTPIEPHHTPKVLIIEGPYRLSRNPIYLALVMLTLSSAIGHGSPVGLICATALWWVLDRRFVRPEEAGLISAFGDEATDYIRKTRRWI